MATTEVIRDMPPAPLLDVDPNVTVPKHVREAAAAAEAIHRQSYATEPEPPAPEPEPPAPEPEPPAPEPAPPPHQDSQQQPQEFTQGATAAEIQNDPWAARYNSMFGRWQASERQRGVMQQQLSDLAGELQRTQELLTRSSTPEQQPQTHKQLITDQDRENYGDELIDVARRAAKEAMGPELDQLRAENSDLKKRVTSTAQSELKQTLTTRIPNWVTINRSDDFKRWLSLPNIYTREVRGKMLNAAYAAADAPQVIAMFNDFINEVKATGGEVPGARQEQQQVATSIAPRQPALQLETLAAPGRARPAGGDANLPADKPTYTRAQIRNFYADVRRNAYAGRETDKHRIEQDIIAAQSEGRVRG